MKHTLLKIIALSAVIASTLSLTACNKGTDIEAENTAAAPIGTVAPAQTPSEAAAIPENDTEKETEQEPADPTNTSAPDDTKAADDTTNPEAAAPVQTKLETELTPIIITTPSAEIIPVIPPPDEKYSAAADTALAQVGKEFKLGGASPEQGFDNSGLVYYCLTQNGIKCPRTAKEMSEIGEKKTMDKLVSGDIAFFNMDDSAKTLFVALYIGDDKIVISTDEGKPVKTADINSVWYKNAFVYGITPQG